MHYKRIFWLCFTVLMTLLTGCDSAMYNQTVANTADVTQRTTEARHKSNADAKAPPALVVNQGLYVDKTPISLVKQPMWLKNHIIIRGDQLPFSYYSRTIAAGGGRRILTRYQEGLTQDVKVSMNFSGTVKEALDALSARTGYAYSVSGGNIYWQAFITKTFDIAFMPGSSDYLMGKAGSTSGGGTSSGGGGAAGASVTGIIDDSAAAQYSNLKGTLSVWKDLEASIKQLMSPNGRVVVSQTTTTVTVRDKPSNIALISQFIRNLNKSLSRQVLIKIQVLDIALDSAYNYGINWAIIQSAFNHSNYQLLSNNGTPISINSLGSSLSSALTSVGIQQLPNPTGVTRTGFTVLVDALKQQGKLSVVTEPRVLCQNNQVSSIRIIKQQGYLASIQTTTLSGSSTGGASITSQITPGSLVTGVTLYVLPKIMGDKVYLQVNADLSSSGGFDVINSSTGGDPGTSPPAGSSSIQVPKVQQKQFNQRSIIKSGNTLILSGFRQVTNVAGAKQMFDSQALGGMAAGQVTLETIVLITPIILHGLG